MRIDCHECEMYRSQHCDDCLVTALLHPPEGVVDLDESLDPALEVLAGAALIPLLKFRPRAEAQTEPTGDPAAEAG